MNDRRKSRREKRKIAIKIGWEFCVYKIPPLRHGFSLANATANANTWSTNTVSKQGRKNKEIWNLHQWRFLELVRTMITTPLTPPSPPDTSALVFPGIQFDSIQFDSIQFHSQISDISLSIFKLLLLIKSIAGSRYRINRSQRKRHIR